MTEAPTSPAGGSHESGGEQSPHSGLREQDRYLPIANISRIMKKALPANGKIAKDAKDTVQECVSEFISFITSEASDKCQKEKRKTINGDDLLWAMATLGFEDYTEPLKAYLMRYREGDTKGSSRGGDGSAKRDTVGALPGQNAQYALQGALNYVNPQGFCFPSLSGLCSVSASRLLCVPSLSGLCSVSASPLLGFCFSSASSSALHHHLSAPGQYMIVPSMQGDE